MLTEIESSTYIAATSPVAHYQALMNGRRIAIPAELTRSEPVDWADAPLRQTIRPGLASVPVASDFDSRLWRQTAAILDAPRLAQLLLAAHGILRRRLDVNWNSSASQAASRNPIYARGASSGGGLYPTELYAVTNGMPGLPDGVYNYCEAHSTLARVRMGHFAHTVSGALPLPSESCESYLILTLRFWKNVFKYHSFGYQLMLQDAGASAATLSVACRELGLRDRLFPAFHEREIGELLGVAEDEEAPVLLMGVSSGASSASKHAAPQTEVVPLRTRPLERSARVSIPQLVLELHRATRQQATEPESSLDLSSEESVSSCESVLDGVLDFPAILRNRESCWGRFRAQPAMEEAELMHVLRFATEGAGLRFSFNGRDAARVCVLAMRVKEIAVGAYDYCVNSGRLQKVGDAPATPSELQKLYWMQNYNLSQASVVIAIVGATRASFDAWGDHSIRILNFAAGAIAQRIYLGSSSLGLGCGVVFGFNVAATGEYFHLIEGEEAPLLMAFVGPRSPSAAAYDFRVSGALSERDVFGSSAPGWSKIEQRR
jgi:SagB-type dehydrogenase family enzyme